MAKTPSRTPARRPAASPRSVVPEDLEVARKEALLQLRIGRSAHWSAIVASAILALDAIVILFLFPALPSAAASIVRMVSVRGVFYLLLPIAGGVAVAAVGLASKWEAFQVWPWEPHFAASVAAVAVTVLAAILYALGVLGIGPTGHLPLYPTLVPLSLLGTSVALVAAAATWRPWSVSQWASAAAASAPVAIAALLYVPPTYSPQHLAIALLVSALLYQTSGSFLHLVSSGTGPHQDVVVLTGQNRIVRLAGEVQQREEAIRFRESALVKREADSESAEQALRRARATHDERETHLQKLEDGYRQLAEQLAGRERDITGREAALEAQARAVGERGKEVEVRTTELSRQVPELATREQRVALHEGDLTRRDIELRQRAEELDRRQNAVADAESRIAARRREIDQKTNELLRREGGVTARERGAAGTPHVSPPGPDLPGRELRVQQLKSLLDEQNIELGRRTKEIAEQAKVAEAGLRQVSERQAHLAAREAELSQRETDLQERLKAADERRMHFETAARDYQRRLDDAGKLQVTLAQRGADLERRSSSLTEREMTVGERESRLKVAVGDLDRREGAVVLRERSVDADEAEVGLRRQAIAREGGEVPAAGPGVTDLAEGASAFGPSRPLRGRPPKPLLGAQDTTTAETGTLAAPTGRKYADRRPTGTPRLDDLLLGGLPPKSHTVLVGEAFVGKEVALYAFVAEGLKRGEPALLVTAARSSGEISESLGVVLPQFREYEQMGTVTWVDASGTGGAQGPHRIILKGSDDRAGLLSALVQGAKQAEEAAKGGAFRVGFFGLSAVLAHADERASFSFLQNVVGILKPRNALAMYALEAGALSEAQVESLLGRMDGAILFRQDRDRTFLSVKGFGDVATRDWVEVRATNRTLVVGSFALERIR